MKTSAERQQKHRDEAKKKGFVRTEIWLQAETRRHFQELCQERGTTPSAWIERMVKIVLEFAKQEGGK